MKSAKNTQAAKSGLTQTESATVFRKIWQKVFGRQKPVSGRPVYPSALLEVRFEKIDAYARSALSSHAMLFRQIGYTVRVEPLQRQIPDEYIGILTVESGELQGLQEYLQILVEYVEKKSLVSRRLESTAPTAASNIPVNHNLSCHEISGKDNNNLK
jgi:hypothetical protein